MSVFQIIREQLKNEDLSFKKSLREQVNSVQKSMMWTYGKLDNKLSQAIDIEKLPWSIEKDKTITSFAKQIDELRKRLALDYKILNKLEKQVEEIC